MTAIPAHDFECRTDVPGMCAACGCDRRHEAHDALVFAIVLRVEEAEAIGWPADVTGRQHDAGVEAVARQVREQWHRQVAG